MIERKWNPEDPDDVVETVYNAIKNQGFHWHYNKMHDAVAELGAERIVELLERNNEVVFTTPVDTYHSEAIQKELSKHGKSTESIYGVLHLMIGGHPHHYYFFDDPSLGCMDGRRIHGAFGANIVIVNRVRMLAEALMYSCQNSIAKRVIGNDDTLARKLRYIMQVNWRSKFQYYHPCVAGEDRLPLDRLNAAFRSFLSIAALRKDYDLVERKTSLALDLGNKSKRILECERASSLNKIFTDVEFDTHLDDDKISQIEKSANDLWSSGVIFRIDGVGVHFRRMAYTGNQGQYNDMLKSVFISIHHTGTFAHEWAHAFDYACGRLSSKDEFRGLHNKYVELITPSLDGSHLYGYYTSATESFARCFEIYVADTFGMNELTRDISSSVVHPKDDHLRLLVRRYFNRVLRRGVASSMTSSIVASDQTIY